MQVDVENAQFLKENNLITSNFYWWAIHIYVNLI